MPERHDPNGLYTYDAVITSVYDGDTATANVDLGFGVSAIKVKLRFYGIDTPEIRGGTELTKQAARKSRDYVKDKILGKRVRIKSLGKGKYGRYLAIIWYFNDDSQLVSQDLNSELIKEGLAEIY
jgi:micrococcal nuclease